MLRTVQATRYVTPLREGGSLPALVEADDLGMYVLKFRGAGQGPLALVAEIVAGEIGRALGLKVPELVLVEVDAALGRNEPDAEIRDLLRASVGLNLGVDFLPGSVMFDPAAGDKAAPELASAAVWFDAFVTNVDRTARNPNLLYWHKALYFIDHGAALYFHHAWSDPAASARSRFPVIRDHVLLPGASEIEKADAALRPRLSEALFSEIVASVPDAWLAPDGGPAAPNAKRAAYVDYLQRRLEAAPLFVEEAIRARAALL
ncbi:MAG: aminotransferase class I and II [Bryobacteraceae bacterium]|nr:aminotransferase class I and II [Bryobacteraceae bacterium]